MLVLTNLLEGIVPWRVVGNVLEFEAGDRTWRLSPVSIGEGLPSDLRRWMDAGGGDGIPPVLIARRMTRGSRQLLDEHGLSWADEAGVGVIRQEGLFFSRLPPAQRLPSRSTVWGPSASAAAEVVLHHAIADDDDVVARPRDIAEATGYSYAQVSKALLVFDELGYMRKEGAARGPSAHRRFRDRGRLLSDWAGHHARETPQGEWMFHVPWRDPRRSLEVFRRRIEVPWVVTGALAAEEMAPHLTHVADATVCVPFDDVFRLRASLLADDDISEVDEGGRLRVVAVPRQVLALSSERAAVPLASPIRVYGDLLRAGSRNADAAEFLREAVIGF